jgi:hypothetical protein
MSFAKPWRHVSYPSYPSTTQSWSKVSVHIARYWFPYQSVKKPFPELFDAKRSGLVSYPMAKWTNRGSWTYVLTISETPACWERSLCRRDFFSFSHSALQHKRHICLAELRNSKSKPNNQTKHCMCLACLRFGLVWWAFENVGTTAIKSLILAWRVWSSTRGPHRVHLSCRAIVSLSFWVDNVTVTAHRLLFLPYHPIWKCRKQWMGFQLKNDCINSNMTQKRVPQPATPENSCIYARIYFYIQGIRCFWHIPQGSDNARLINFAADGLGFTLHKKRREKWLKKTISTGRWDNISTNAQLNPRFAKSPRTSVLRCIDKHP